MIPPTALFYSQRLGDGVYSINVEAGPTIPATSTIEYPNTTSAEETTITAGKLSYIDIQSRDSYGAILFNNNDNYLIHFVGPSPGTSGEFSVAAVCL